MSAWSSQSRHRRRRPRRQRHPPARPGGHLRGAALQHRLGDALHRRPRRRRPARELGADVLLILTDVPRAYLAYGTPERDALEAVTAAEMRAHAAAGHFKVGSMGPKVEACLPFAEAGGTAVIASLIELEEAMAGEAGTRIVPDAGEVEEPGGHAGKLAKGARRSRAKAAGEPGAGAATPGQGRRIAASIVDTSGVRRRPFARRDSTRDDT